MSVSPVWVLFLLSNICPPGFDSSRHIVYFLCRVRRYRIFSVIAVVVLGINLLKPHLNVNWLQIIRLLKFLWRIPVTLVVI